MHEQSPRRAEQLPANLTALQQELAEIAAKTNGKPAVTVRPCRKIDFETIYTIVNDAAEAYRGVIPVDCWRAPYMSREELRHEIAQGVTFWCCEQDPELVGVMGLQDVMDVTLIRHAYVRAGQQHKGLGGNLLAELPALTTRPTLVGTWAAAEWAIRFYRRHGFQMVSPAEKDRLFQKYWSISDRQIETSVVLADEQWCSLPGHGAACPAG